MIKLPLCCRCARLKDFERKEYEKIVAHCEAYPDGIPEAVIYAGHFFPKPDDNGLQFIPENPNEHIKEHIQKVEDKEYKELKRYYEELDMTDDDWVKAMQKKNKLSDNPLEIEAALSLRPKRETEPRKW